MTFVLGDVDLGVWCTGADPKVAIFFLIRGSIDIGVDGGVGGGVVGGVSGSVTLGVGTTGGSPKQAADFEGGVGVGGGLVGEVWSGGGS